PSGGAAGNDAPAAPVGGDLPAGERHGLLGPPVVGVEVDSAAREREAPAVPVVAVGGHLERLALVAHHRDGGVAVTDDVVRAGVGAAGDEPGDLLGSGVDADVVHDALGGVDEDDAGLLFAAWLAELR